MRFILAFTESTIELATPEKIIKYQWNDVRDFKLIEKESTSYLIIETPIATEKIAVSMLEKSPEEIVTLLGQFRAKSLAK